jgi:hypothetical protein
VRKPGLGSRSEQYSPRRFRLGISCQTRLRHPVPCWIRCMASLVTKGASQNATPGGWKWNPLFLRFCCRHPSHGRSLFFRYTEGLILNPPNKTIHDFILLFMPPCGPHLTPLATGSLERSLLVFSTPGGLTGNDLSRLFFTCTNTSQAATCTCNT